ncbi:MAG TPA: alanyl-tRNA editing protein [Clostridia bacterium]|nr:alanyl-tRNA editing protein [Clostridia bacterium]
MSVEKVFWTDPYLTKLSTRITSAANGTITLERTIAFAFSGGQASDTGTINGRSILKAEKLDKEIFYTLEGPQDMVPGDEALIEIDWERRYRIMKLHFAAEIILELVNRHFGNPAKIGANIADTKARLDFIWDKNISDIFPFLQSEAEKLIESELPISSAFSDTADEKRYWEIKGFGRVSCGGTHIRNTGEIGRIRLKRGNIGKGKERIEIYLAEDLQGCEEGKP